MVVTPLMFVLAILAIALTCTMFLAEQMMLGFPAAMFWAVFGGYCYTQSTATWDIYYLLFFASTFGMTIFCMLAAYGLRRRDIEPRKGDWLDSGKYIDGEGSEGLGQDKDEGDGDGSEEGLGEKPRPSARARELRERAARRRTGVMRKKVDYGEFK